MEHQTLEEISKVAQLTRVDRCEADAPRWVIRRRRLERLASLLEANKEPVQLFLAMEWVSKKKRPALRQDCSPLTIAYADPQFRREGLGGDSVGDGMAFFQLSLRQVHALFCECRYAHSDEQDTAKLVAKRVRSYATKVTFGEVCDKLGAAIERWRQSNKQIPKVMS